MLEDFHIHNLVEPCPDLRKCGPQHSIDAFPKPLLILEEVAAIKALHDPPEQDNQIGRNPNICLFGYGLEGPLNEHPLLLARQPLQQLHDSVLVLSGNGQLQSLRLENHQRR